MTTTATPRATPHPTGDARKGWTLAAAAIGVIYAAVPVLNVISGAAGDAAALGAAFLTIPVMLTQVSKAPRLIAWVLIFCVTYGVSALASPDSTQGLRHTTTAMAASGALLLFATFGRSMVEYRAFRAWIYTLVAAGVIAMYGFAGLQKNITGGVLLYLVALLIAVLLSRPRRRPWRYVVAFLAVATALGFMLDFRSMIGYAAILVLAYFGAVTLPNRVYWLVGIVGATTVIAATIWYFLNVYTSELATIVTILVIDSSGRPATSGRDWLWPAIVSAVERQPWFGLGAGALPRDILPTTLSAHSYYLQVYLQLGLIGLILLVMVLLSVWKPLAYSNSTIGRFGAAVFLMFVTHNATEVLMFQNALIASIPAWCAIGLAMSFALDEMRSSRRELANRSQAANPSRRALRRLA